MQVMYIFLLIIQMCPLAFGLFVWQTGPPT